MEPIPQDLERSVCGKRKVYRSRRERADEIARTRRPSLPAQAGKDGTKVNTARLAAREDERSEFRQFLGGKP